jgi:hypothetical protein
MISLGIGIVILGATVIANQSINRNAQVVEQQSQMASLVNESIDELTLTHTALRQANAAFSSAFTGIVVNGPAVPTVAYRNYDATKPTVIKTMWCTQTTPGFCTALNSPVGVIDNAPYLMMNFFTDLTGAELLAIHHIAPVQDVPQQYDMLAVNSSGTRNTVVFTQNTSNQKDWNFFQRKVTISARSDVYPSTTTYIATISVWPNGAASTAGITRTVTFTDY